MELVTQVSGQKTSHKGFSSTILRLFLTWILRFLQAFTNLDQNGIHQHS